MCGRSEIMRVVFYSAEDMSTNDNLIEAEKILENFNPEQIFTFNDLIEFYNINLYFQNSLFLKSWSELDRRKYNSIVEKTWSILKERLINTNDDNIDEILKDLGYNYEKNFWELINKLNIYKNISHSKFNDILKRKPSKIYSILSQKKIVHNFNRVIRDFLLEYENSAEIILSQFEEKKSNEKSEHYYFPNSLSLADKEMIIISYLERDDPNLNYVRLAEKSKDSNELKLSEKTRYKAKIKAEKQNIEIFEKGHTWNISVQVGLNENQEKPVKYKNENGLFEVIYSEKYFDQIDNDTNLFKVFSHVFSYTDETSLIALVSKANELDVLERVMGLKSKNEYEYGVVFTKKNILSNLQLHIIDKYLKRKNSGIEQLINSFILHINELLNHNKLIFNLRVLELPELDKILILLPSFDFLLKQYKNLAEDGEIDIELLRSSSKPIGFSQISSKNKKKYIYSNHKEILYIKRLFFSNQSHLFYTEKFKTKHKNLFDLLTEENMILDDFANYQKRIIQNLINDGYIKINKKNNLEIERITFLYILRELYRNEVINYWHYPSFVREEIDNLIKEEKLYFENTLFSKEEVKYLNYFLNQKIYTNGYDLRNQYSHGTYSLSEEKHKNDYFLLLKMIILALLKIEDDIIINKNYQLVV